MSSRVQAALFCQREKVYQVQTCQTPILQANAKTNQYKLTEIMASQNEPAFQQSPAAEAQVTAQPVSHEEVDDMELNEEQLEIIAGGGEPPVPKI